MQDDTAQLMTIQNRYIQIKRLFEYSIVRKILPELYKRFQEYEKKFITLVNAIHSKPNIKEFSENKDFQETTKMLDERFKRIKKDWKD